jgi:hypothetical protein
VYVPFNTAIAHEQRSHGNTSCSKDSGVGYKGFLASECIWMHAWFELASASDRPRRRRGSTRTPPSSAAAGASSATRRTSSST